MEKSKPDRETWRCCACGGVTEGPRHPADYSCGCFDEDYGEPWHPRDPQYLAELMESGR